MKIDDLSLIEQKQPQEDSLLIDKKSIEQPSHYHNQHYIQCPLKNRVLYQCPICTRLRYACPYKHGNPQYQQAKFQGSKMSTNINIDEKNRSQSHTFKNMFESRGAASLQPPSQYHSLNNTSSFQASCPPPSLHHRAPTTQSQIVQPLPRTPHTVKEQIVYYPVIHNQIVRMESTDLSRSQRTPTRSRRSMTCQSQNILTPTQFKDMVDLLRSKTEM